MFFALIASLLVSLPGSAEEFRGNPFALGGSSKTGDASAGVDGSSGAATWSVPITAPPGPGGLSPTLSLNYSSNGGDGPFGLGWNLQLGEIRCTARFGAPDYANCPEFELDGQLLVGPDAQGLYHTKVESFQRIRLLGTGNFAHWEVTAPGGTRLLYGEGLVGGIANSKIGSDGEDTPATAPTARWLLSKVADLQGNEILFTYDRTDVGVAYPSTISYASGEREIRFLYESRPDEILDFSGGVPRNLTQRLREIEIKSLGTIFSRLLIDYSTVNDYSTHRSRIVSSQLFGKGCTNPNPVNCQSLPAQTFSYTNTSGTHWPSTPNPAWNTGFFVENYFQLGTWAETGKRIADVDGDGLPDLVIGRCSVDDFPCNQPGQGPTVYINDGSGWVKSAAWTNAIDSLSYEAPTITLELVTIPKPFGNGSIETICDATYGVLERKIHFADDSGDGVRLDGATETYAAWSAWQLVDLNGDGLADLVNSVRAQGTFHTVNCAGESLDGGEYFYYPIPGSQSTKVYLNNGAGWDEAPAMEQGLPTFQALAIVRAEFDSYFPGSGGIDCQEDGWMGGLVGDVCSTWMDLRPQFVELNGDGLLDLIVLEPLSPEDMWLSFYNGFSMPPQGTGRAQSKAWLQNADGTGWTPAPEFDLFGLAHIKFNHVPRLFYEGGNMISLDAGVHFVDLNRDGLTDVVHDWSFELGYPQGSAGILLNTGTGWCSDLGDAAIPCDGNTAHSRYDPPIRFTEWENNDWLGYSNPSSKSQQLVFVDLNGDGWVDLLQGKGDTFDEINNPQTLRAWLHDPSAPPDSGGSPSVWVERPEFAPPVPIRAGTQFIDLDGNGAVDIIHGRTIIFEPSVGNVWEEAEAYLAPDTYSDLLASVDNGRGGLTDFTYVSAAFQRDEAMEIEAEDYASVELGDADGNSAAVTRFTAKPVVSEYTLSGVGIAPNVTTRYKYARPRFDPVDRSGLGFGLVETTNPDSSRVDAYYYQREGLVGRPSLQNSFDPSGNQIHTSSQTWGLAPDPGSIPGAMAGVDVARVSLRRSNNVYGANEGPENSTSFSYDDSYGYNFISQVINTRATGSLTTTFTPDLEAYDKAKWLVGLLGDKRQLAAGTTQSHETYDYTQNGQLASRSRDIGLRDGTAASDIATTSWRYDSYGNVISQTDTRGGGEANRVVEFCYDGGGGGNSWCPSLPGGTTATHSLRVGVKDAIGDVTELEYDWVTGAVLHVERFNESGAFRDSMTMVRDAFGRRIEQWFRGASFGGGDSDVQLAATTYFDEPSGSLPAYIERFQFTEEVGGVTIRSARYLDGFGNASRIVEETPSGYRGTAVFRDPVAGVVRSVGPIDCDSDASCSNITETTEPATEQEIDAAGRVIRITSPDGEATRDYSWMLRVQPIGSGTGDLFDTVEITDSNDNMIRRLMDGNRIAWVDECQAVGCASFDSTFYTYEATGEISTIYDALAAATPDYASSARYLRYFYDTLGRVIQTDEPNTGSSFAGYDHQGNITSTTNVRGATTDTHYDALGRILSIVRPAGVGEWDLDFSYDPISRRRESVTTLDSSYSDVWEYDDFGQVSRQIQTYNDTLVMDFEYDLLGRPTKINYPSDGARASYVYEGAYLKQVCRGDDFCVSTPENLLISDVQYDDLGRRTDTVTPEGTLHSEYFDILDAPGGRLVNGLKRLAITAGDAFGALDFYYQYDPIGNITDIDDQSTTYDASATYTYDARNRLASWTDANSVTQWYTYDALGNLKGHGVASEGGTNQTFDPSTKPHQIGLNRAAENYAYDADGNVVKRGPAHFVYDSANRLVCTGSSPGSCDGPGYRYDVDGQLLWDGAADQQLMGELFKWNSSFATAHSNIAAFGEVIAEVKQTSAQLSGPSGSVPIAWPLPRPKGPLLWMLTCAGVLALTALLGWLGVGPAFSEAPATAALALVLITLLVVPPTAWGGPRRGGRGGGGGGGGNTVTTVRGFFRDHLGSVAYVTSPNRRQVYEPFGKEILAAGVAADEFTGKAYHSATDMYYFGARWYDAEAGRFAGVDPLVAHPGDPQNLSAYSYVLNDPVNLVDPTGMVGVPTRGIEEIIVTGTRGRAGAWGSGIKSMTVSHAAGMFRLSAPIGHNLPSLVQAGMILDGYVECCGEQGEGGDSSQSEDAPYDLAAAGPDAIDQLRRLADSIHLIDAMNEAEREVERLWVNGKKNGQEKFADADAWAWKGMHFQREPNNPFLEAFDHWSVEIVRTPAGTPRDSVPEPRPLSISSGGVKWIRPPTRIYCANCPSGVKF